MQLAFCSSLQPLLISRKTNLLSTYKTHSSLHVSTPTCAASKGKRKSSKQRRAKRPRTTQSTSNLSSKSTPPIEQQPIAQAETEQQLQSDQSDQSGRDLKKKDKAGISLENRLREEIAHPLRKPKLTLFAALAFSATLGLFFALARAQKDTPVQVVQNIAVDLAAIAVFAWLAWREVQFGRRSLNSLAGQPEARDLPIVLLEDEKTLSLPLVGNQTRRLGELFKGNDVIIVAGRAADLRKYLDRCTKEAASSDKVRIVALPTDLRREEEEEFEGAVAVAAGKTEYVRDWIAWVGDAVPPRKNLAMFKIQAKDDGLKSASSYVVAVSEPSTLPLPVDARRELSEV